MGYTTPCRYCGKIYVAHEYDSYTWKADYCSAQCSRAASERIRAAEEKKEREEAAKLQREANHLLEIQIMNERFARNQAEERAKREAEERAKREAEERRREAEERAKLRNCKWCGRQYDFTASGAGHREVFCGRKCENDFKNDVLHGNSSSVTGDDWVMVILDDQGAFNKCPLKKLAWHNWNTLFNKYPQFTKYCPLQQFNRSEQDALLRHAEMRRVALTKFPDVLSGEHWVSLICDDPGVFAKCPQRKLSRYDWQKLCARHPQFIESFPWQNFNEDDQYRFLTSSENIREYILTKHANYLNSHQWAGILLSSPNLFNQCPVHKLTLDDWKYLIRHNSNWLKQCPLENFTQEEQNELRTIGGQIVSRQQTPVKEQAQDNDTQQGIAIAILFIGGILLAIFCSIWWVRWIICPFLILAGIMASIESGSQNKTQPPTNSNKTEVQETAAAKQDDDNKTMECLAVIFLIGAGVLLGIFCSIWWVRWIVAPILVGAGILGISEAAKK